LSLALPSEEVPLQFVAVVSHALPKFAQYQKSAIRVSPYDCFRFNRFDNGRIRHALTPNRANGRDPLKKIIPDDEMKAFVTG
jgi:hypothetical protein